MRLSEFAADMGSQVLNPRGDAEISGISTLEDAKPGQISFIADKKYLKLLPTTKAEAVLLPEGLHTDALPSIVLKEVWGGVLHLLNHFHPGAARTTYKGIHATAVIDSAARLPADCSVGPNAVIGLGALLGARVYVGPGCVIGPGCVVGDDCILHANAVLEAGCELGSSVIVQAGAVIGADGFKYEILGGKWTKIPQVGNVVISDSAEIGSNTCIDRASYTATRIGKNSKIDNLVQIAHNVQVGNHCVVVAQCGIAGSSKIGDHSILAAQVGIADNIKLGKGVVVLAQSGVKDDVPDGTTMFGSPARTMKQRARIIASETRLPRLLSEFARLSKRVEELEKRLATTGEE